MYKYLQAYTTLELLYDGTQFVIIGNPVVLSGTDYSIFADGLKRVNTVVSESKDMVNGDAIYKFTRMKFEKSVTCARGDTIISLNTNYAYLLIASGSNYGKAIFFVLNGYNSGTVIERLLGNGLTASVNAFKEIKITNNGDGDVSMSVYVIN